MQQSMPLLCGQHGLAACATDGGAEIERLEDVLGLGDQAGAIWVPGVIVSYVSITVSMIPQTAAWSLRRKLPGRAPVARFTCRLR